MFVSPWVHRHQQLWEDSTMFHPERFQTQSIRNDGRYLPFGLGPQMCLGRMRSADRDRRRGRHPIAR